MSLSVLDNRQQKSADLIGKVHLICLKVCYMGSNICSQKSILWLQMSLVKNARNFFLHKRVKKDLRTNILGDKFCWRPLFSSLKNRLRKIFVIMCRWTQWPLLTLFFSLSMCLLFSQKDFRWSMNFQILHMFLGKIS